MKEQVFTEWSPVPPVQPGRYWYTPLKGGVAQRVDVVLVAGELLFRPIEGAMPISVGSSTGWWREDDEPEP